MSMKPVVLFLCVIMDDSSWFCENEKLVCLYWWLIAIAAEVAESVVGGMTEAMETTKASGESASAAAGKVVAEFVILFAIVMIY